MEKVKVINTLSPKPRNRQGQKFTQPSQTIPDRSLSLKHIIKAHLRGEDLPNSQIAFYDEENGNQIGVNPKTLDISELKEMQMEAQAKIQQMQLKLQQAIEQRKLKDEEEFKAKAKREAAIEEILNRDKERDTGTN